ncbi:MAG: DUF1592 domain-containing protein [Pseudomonadales bacterium]|nr:DUF1592 domain-containing protein [Pseudomonadales bacterium]
MSTMKTLAFCLMALPALGAGPAHAAQDDSAQHWPMLEQYCVQCHGLDDFAGGIAFDLMDPAQIPAEAEVWEKVVRKLRGGMMPPPGESRPDQARSAAFVSWLEQTLDSAARGQRHPGNVALHRLNRREYEYAVKDLLGIDFDADALLPKDDVSDGFDNVADVLQVSPSFIDQYLNAARVLSTQAVGDASLRQKIVVLRADPAQDQTQHIDGLPLGTRGGVIEEHVFPADGDYSFNLNVFAQYEEYRHRVIMTVDGEQVFESFIGGPEEAVFSDQQGVEARRSIQGRFQDIRLPLTAGRHEIGASFVANSLMESEELLFTLAPGNGFASGGPRISAVQISGPLNPVALGTTPSRARIFSCYPQTAADEDACADEIIGKLATRAFRRPASAEDKAGPLHFYRAGRERENFEAGIQNALMAILASPGFLYRTEIPPAAMNPGDIYTLNGLELATRLAFFLWSSVPDQELLDLGSSGELLDETVMAQQVERMLADPRAEALVSNFAFQWLDVNKVDDIDPDPSLFPEFNTALAEAFKEEMRLFVGSIFLQDRPVPELLSADYSYVNERLAEHYGIAGVLGNRFRRVTLSDESRWGLLGKGSILLTTSYPNRTAPVLRGAWILERIIGTPPNAPPPNVEALKESGDNGEAMTVRELMVQHRSNPSCNSCHGVMDPLGLALENFDAVGGWQSFDRYARRSIDASGELPDGTPLNSPADLRRALLHKPEQFVQTLTEKLMTFALGRTVEYQDMPRIREIISVAEGHDYRFSTLIKGIVNSEQFRMKALAELSEEDEAAGSEQGLAATRPGPN